MYRQFPWPIVSFIESSRKIHIKIDVWPFLFKYYKKIQKYIQPFMHEKICWFYLYFKGSQELIKFIFIARCLSYIFYAFFLSYICVVSKIAAIIWLYLCTLHSLSLIFRKSYIIQQVFNHILFWKCILCILTPRIDTALQILSQLIGYQEILLVFNYRIQLFL